MSRGSTVGSNAAHGAAERAATSQQASKEAEAAAGPDHKTTAEPAVEPTSTPIQAGSPKPGTPAPVAAQMPQSPPKVSITLL